MRASHRQSSESLAAWENEGGAVEGGLRGLDGEWDGGGAIAMARARVMRLLASKGHR